MAKNKSSNKDNKIVLDFKKELESIKNSIDSLSVDVDMLKEGNENGPLWNGSNAVDCIKSLDKFVNNSSSILDNLDIISNELK